MSPVSKKIVIMLSIALSCIAVWIFYKHGMPMGSWWTASTKKSSSQARVPAETDFILVRADHAPCDGITLLRNKIEPMVNMIIAQELNLPPTNDALDTQKTDAQKTDARKSDIRNAPDSTNAVDKKGHDAPHIKIMPHQNLTLYYLNDYARGNESLLTTAFADFIKRDLPLPCTVELSPEAEFFGDGKDDIVIKIHDGKKCLYMLNTAIKALLSDLYKEYRTNHKEPLYNRSQSERFAYTPHIHLGRLPFNHERYKKYFAGKEGVAIENIIKERIKDEVFPLITHIVEAHHYEIVVTSISLMNLTQKRDIGTF